MAARTVACPGPGRERQVRRRRLPALLALLLVVPLLGLVGGTASAIESTWTAQQADAVGAADLASGGAGVKVAVLDSWIDSRHPDFQGRVLGGATCRGGTCEPGGADVPDSCEAHGTHVAGLVGSSRFGIAPQSSILPVRVLTQQNGACTAQATDVASGIRWAVANGAKVINISLGSTYALNDQMRVIPRAVSEAKRQGVVVVVAAGNGQTAGVDVYGDKAIVVAATGPDGNLAAYSQRGNGVDLAAPGGQPSGGGCTPDDCVVSTWSDRAYAADAGTSMAAPLVAGTAALLLAQQPDRGPDAIEETLRRTARPLAGAGAGRLDVLAAVRGSAAGTNPAAQPAPAPAGPASAGDTSVTRVLGPDGKVQQGQPVNLAGGQGTSSQNIIMAAAAALVFLVFIALVVVVRTQGVFGDRR